MSNSFTSIQDKKEAELKQAAILAHQRQEENRRKQLAKQTLEQEISQLEHEIRNLENKIHESEREDSSLETEASRAESEIQLLKQSGSYKPLDGHETREIEALRNREKQEMQTLARIKHELSRINAKIEETRNKISELSQGTSREKGGIVKNSLGILESRLSEKRGKEKELEQLIKKETSLLKQLEERIATEEHELRALQQKLESDRHTALNVQSKIESDLSGVRSLETEESRIEREKTDEEQHQGQSKGLEISSKIKIHSLEATLKTLEQEQIKKEQLALSLESELASQKASEAEIGENIKASQKQHQDTSSVITQTERNMALLRRKILHLQTNQRAWERELARYKTELGEKQIKLSTI